MRRRAAVWQSVQKSATCWAVGGDAESLLTLHSPRRVNCIPSWVPGEPQGGPWSLLSVKCGDENSEIGQDGYVVLCCCCCCWLRHPTASPPLLKGESPFSGQKYEKAFFVSRILSRKISTITRQLAFFQQGTTTVGAILTLRAEIEGDATGCHLLHEESN